jgi:PAS domain S-box-containing protein
MRSGFWWAALPAGAAFAVVLCACVLWLVPQGDVSRWLRGGSIAAVAALVALLTAFATRRHYRRLLLRLATQVEALRENPAPHLLHYQGGAADPATPELAALSQQVAALAACYRKALAELVQAHERLEALCAGQDHGNREQACERLLAPAPPPFTRYVVGSSRHRMVARLTPTFHWMAATLPLQQFLHRTMADLVARPFLDVVHPDDAPALAQALREVLKEGEGHNITFRVLRHAEHHLQMDVMTCYTDAGTPLHLRCHILDVTDRVRTERELLRRTEEVSQANDLLRQINTDLQRLKESYRDLYHHAPVMYFSLDLHGRFVAFNETMVRTLGYPREALLGRPCTLLLPPAGRAALRADPAMFQRPGELETQWVKQDGTVVDVWVGTTTVKDRDGGFVRSRSAARDVTERNRLATDLRNKAEELEQANVQLRRINQELADFTYVASHDLKEPLRTLEAFSNFLAQDYGAVLAGEGRAYLDHLTQASRRLGALIDDLLALSRAGRVIHTPHAFAWGPVLETVRCDLRDLIQRQRATMRVEGPLPSVAGDAVRVMELLSNLVSNGIKYNKDPHPEVVIGSPEAAGCPAPPAAPDFVTFFVRDNGVGIEPRYHERIFRMFQRLHRRDEVDGTGAGLAICKRIVEAHGGRLWVASEPGQGSTFFFTLPRLAPPSVPNRPGDKETEPPSVSLSPGLPVCVPVPEEIADAETGPGAGG